MFLTRRELLNRLGVLSAGFWLADLPLARRYKQVLAQSTPRKLALLVGVNHYRPHALNLRGAQTDLELHRELLVHRFGFRDVDVLTLVDEDATRANIESAFVSHLINQVRPGDVVVFHFSGYGCLVRTKAGVEGEVQSFGEQQALMSSDAWMLNPGSGQPFLFNGIYEDTLLLLLRSLPTDQVITFLDMGVRPALDLRCKSLRDRALPLWESEAFSGAEFAFQERLLQQTQQTRDQLQVQRKSGQVPGIVLSAATLNQPTALEIERVDFCAGLLSYLWMQQLWSTTPQTSLIVQLGRLSTQMAECIGPSPQQPVVKGQRSSGLLPLSVGGGDIPANVGTILSTDRQGLMAKLWLGGLSDVLLSVYQPQSCFRGVSSATLMQMRSHSGREAVAQHLAGPPLQAGQFLQEAIRILPRSIPLNIALGSNLERIERVDAVSSLSSRKTLIQIVETNHQADYIFTKILAPDPAPHPSDGKNSALHLPLTPLPSASYGLAHLGGAVLPNTSINRGEVIKLALQRLRPTLHLLLALKLLERLVNDTAPEFPVTVTLEQREDLQPLIRLQTPSAPSPIEVDELEEPPPIPKADKTSTVLTLPSSTPIQYRVTNWNDFPLYVLLLGFNSDTTTFMSYGTETMSSELERKILLKPLVILPGTTLLLPSTGQPWKASSGTGLNRVFVMLTRQPLTRTAELQTRLLQTTLPSAANGLTGLKQPLPMVQTVLEDLHAVSLPTTTPWVNPQQGWVLDTQIWILFQFTYRTV